MSIPLDNLLLQPCIIQDADAPVVCPENPVTPPPPVCDDLDVCCGDPAFAEAHPELCDGRPRLILKPSATTVPLNGSVQYKTYLVASGQEVEITVGVVYGTSDPGIAIIGGLSGNATAFAVGIATISAVWQNLQAFAQITVVDDCCEVVAGMVLVVDNSRSMSLGFSSQFSTKLAYAKKAASLFAEETNCAKDYVGAVAFNTGASTVAELTRDGDAVATAIMAIGGTQNSTNLFSGLDLAIRKLDANTELTRRVVVILTDGEQDIGPATSPLASAFKDSGGIIIVIAVRAHGTAYASLQKVSSNGFFASAHQATAVETLQFLSGSKGYFCAGNCRVVGEVNMPELNYDSFVEWDVTGVVDLVGNGGVALFDLLPGNGLYVDLAGSAGLGAIASKQTFEFASASTYKLTVSLAGNQRIDIAGFKVRVTVGVPGGPYIVDEIVDMDDWLQDFTAYEFEFPGDDVAGSVITISQHVIPSGSPNYYGCLLGSVRLDQLTPDEDVLLLDSFDDENPVTLTDEKECEETDDLGNVCYGTGCLAIPIAEQTPDPNPPPQIE